MKFILLVHICCRMAAEPDSKFGIQNKNSELDQYSGPYVNQLTR